MKGLLFLKGISENSFPARIKLPKQKGTDILCYLDSVLYSSHSQQEPYGLLEGPGTFEVDQRLETSIHNNLIRFIV